MALLNWLFRRWKREYDLGWSLQADRVAISPLWPIARQDGWLDADRAERDSARAGLDTGEKIS
jgi:hypothetical protein